MVTNCSSRCLACSRHAPLFHLFRKQPLKICQNVCPSQIVKTTAPAWIMVQSSLCIVLLFLSPWWLLTIRSKTKKSVLTEKRIFFRRNSSELKSALFRFFPPTRKMILENPFVLNLQLFFSFPFSLILHLPSFYFSFCFDPLFHLCSLLSLRFFNFFCSRHSCSVCCAPFQRSSGPSNRCYSLTDSGSNPGWGIRW